MDNLTKNIILTPFNLLYKISAKLDLKILFRLKLGYNLNLKNPVTYNEKLQWIKLYDKNPLMPKCCDKYSVRNYVEEKGYKDILNTLIWEGFDPETIPFDQLPKKFVIKVTHGSTFNIICTDKEKLDKKDAISKCKKWLNAKFIPCYGEWFYGIEKPRIIIEEYLENREEDLKDYKIYCFNGIPRYIGVSSKRGTREYSYNIYDIDWNLQENVQLGHISSLNKIEKPECLDELLQCAHDLSEEFLHARIDFYIVNKKIIFGEITFTNDSGLRKITPKSFDFKIGSYLKLPENTRGGVLNDAFVIVKFDNAFSRSVILAG